MRFYLYQMETILEKVRDFADAAHGEQTRKYSTDRYIVHPVRVMETLRDYNASQPMLAAALLHDVLEDTPVTPIEMLLFLKSVMAEQEAEQTFRMVNELTDVYITTSYPQWNRRVRKDKELERVVKISAESQTIKYADILDNSTEIVKHDPGFAQRYLLESKSILQKAIKGDPELRKLALNVVNRGLSELTKHF